ncbi:MAG: Ig-like domain-containing protein [Bacteroidota bacterium]|nr:Ig-like domain-containing protein [Bacteroidota bacterium]
MNTPIGIDNTAPVVSISSPANNSPVTGTINVTATATDNVSVAGVQFLLDGNVLGAEDISSPYSVSWNTTTATNGNHTLTAKARDAAGNTTTSTGVLVTVNNDTQLPTVNITAPAAGTVAGTLSVTANATDNVGVVGVQFLLNGSNLGTEVLTSPYSFTWNTTTVADGSYTLTAKARDAAGNIQTSSPVIVNVLNNPPDTIPPTVTMTSPAAGEVLGTINVAANANDNIGVVGVQFLLNGTNLGAEDISAPYSVSWNTVSVSNGNYKLMAKARDAAGNTALDSVMVTVNNPPDTISPTVSITAPVAGNVSGTINVTANASDNIGVVGVQFLLDGFNLGTEVLTAPYTVSWNTSLLSNGSMHTLSARARDAAGNITVATDVNVTIANTTPVISGISVSSITSGSSVINWTTNIPANSQVNYGTTTAYGLSTLVDSALVTSHSQILNGLNPGTLYHYRVISGNSSGTPATSTDNTFTVANLASPLGTLNGHTVLADAGGKIVSWTPNPAEGYDSVVKLAWNYLLNSVPNDPLTGKPAYYSRSYLNPNTQQVVDWDHNPASMYAMLTESALKYYQYSGNASVMQLAENVALWHLDHGMTTATDSWANVPYSEGRFGSLTYGGAPQADGVGNLEPDKIGELGFAWLQLYKYDGNTRFRDAAIQAANILSSKIRIGTSSQSPWPFRVNAHDNTVVEDYCADVIGPISLLDGLIAAGLGNTAAYQTARTSAWNWLMTYPMQNNVWTQYFEDVSVQQTYNTNFNQYDANMTARYLLQHPEFDPNWETHVRGILSWVESIFVQTLFGATTMEEQTPVFPWVCGSHTSRYASVNALLYEKTGDLVAKEKAYRSFNFASYMARTNGVVIDGLLYGSESNANQWFSDGYGDYIRHFMTGMGAVPEWSPSNQTHLLRSSSVVKTITYGTNSINYTTYDSSATDVLHVAFTPVVVTADGVALPHRSDLNQPGWTLDVATKTLRIYHSSGTQISINAVAPPSGRMNEVNQLYTDNGNHKINEYTRTVSPQ